jgi:hypothetical protein
MSDDEIREEIARKRSDNWWDYINYVSKITDKEIEEYKNAVAAEERVAKQHLDAASEFVGSDVDYIMERVTEVMPELGEKLKNILGEYYKFGESSETQLSALQQGIQGITETTAGALEAYMNGVSQQVYLHSELLMDIRNTIDNMSGDAMLGTISEILLQLQSSYQTQEAIRSMLEGWSTPSGQAVKVELIS